MTAAVRTLPASRSTAGLLAGGLLGAAGYVGVGLVQILARDGFDITKHQLSVARNGSLGWVQILSFVKQPD